MRDQTSGDRRREITRSLEAGDDSVMSAILSAPPMLSGLNQQEVEGFALMWRQKRFPSELSRIDMLEKAAVHLQRGGQILIGYQRKMSNPGIVAEAAKFAKASSDAIAAATGAH